MPTLCPSSRNALSWVFSRDGLSLTCDVALSAHAYTVSAVPLWAPQAACVEAFESPVAALSRHAELSRQLRESGWVVTAHSGRRSSAN
jgi:hypothetical protein